MKVPLLDLKAQYASIRAEVREAIDRVCDAQAFILGPEVAALEEEIARFCGAKFGVGVSSGTDALLVALMAIDLRPGDEVITSAFSFFATAGVVSRLGGVPVFVDIQPGTFNLDPAGVAARITPRTRAILPVHLFGRCADMDPILHLGIPVIEDAAQSIGSRDAKGRQAGTMGKMGCFSFFPSKNLGAFGDGGMVITDDPLLAERLRVLRVHGSKPKYFHKEVGGNFRLDALQAAVLRVKLKRLAGWTEGRRANADRYRKVLPLSVTVPEDVPGHIYNQFVLRVRERDLLQVFLQQREIGTEVYYPVPLPHQECFAGLGARRGDFPQAEAAAADSLALPIYPELSDEQIRHVAGSIREFYA